MKRLAVLVLIPILLLPACSQPTPEVIKETVVVYVTQQPLPTYTPYPTYTSVPAALTHTPYPTPTPRAATPTSTPTPYPTPTPRATTPTSTPTPVAVPTATPVPTLTVEELAQSLHTPWAAKDWEEVIRLIEQILAINPDYGDMTEKLYAAHVNYARQLAAKGKLEEAKEEFTSALAIKPDGGEAIAELQALGSETPTSQAATPTSEPMPEGKIAFVSEGEFDHFEPYPWEIYVMNADGTGVVRLTENPFFEDEPSWSPDGNRIAFVSGGVGYINIYVMNADGTGRVGLTDGFHNACPTWSPDGRRIAFEIFRDRPGEMNGEIYVMNADGTEQVNLTKNPAEDRSPSWSPDGNRIAFVSDRDGNLEIYVMNADGMGVVRLTDNPSGEHNPMWSPDGNRIAFVSDRDGNLEINVMDADGTGQINLTKNPAEDHYPSWSPDGRRIAFDSNRDGNFEIYVMNADGLGLVNLTTSPANDRMPAWTSVPIPKPIGSPTVTRSSPPPTVTPSPPPKPTPTELVRSSNKLEFIAYGQVACGGIAPLPGCGYTLQEWVGAEGPIAPGGSIKILFMNPRSIDAPDTDSCQGYQVDNGAYDWSDVPIRIRARGEPCDWSPDYLFCVCDPDDFVRLEPSD